MTSKKLLIEAVRSLQSQAGMKVLSPSTLNSKTKDELEQMTRDIQVPTPPKGSQEVAAAKVAARDVQIESTPGNYEKAGEAPTTKVTTKKATSNVGSKKAPIATTNEINAARRSEINDWTRAKCVDALRAAGYDGPTSYLMPKLRDITAAYV